MSISPHDLLHHIIDEINFLISESGILDKNSFLADEKAKRAFARSFEIIGEAAKKIPDDFKQFHADIEWSAMARLRDKLIHHYFGVDYELVWNIVKEDIPPLRNKISKLLEE